MKYASIIHAAVLHINITCLLYVKIVFYFHTILILSQIFINASKVFDGLSADTDDFLHINGVNTTLSGAEGDRDKLHCKLLTCIDHRYHDIG